MKSRPFLPSLSIFQPYQFSIVVYGKSAKHNAQSWAFIVVIIDDLTVEASMHRNLFRSAAKVWQCSFNKKHFIIHRFFTHSPIGYVMHTFGLPWKRGC
jgi:hypothetical protein